MIKAIISTPFFVVGLVGSILIGMTLLVTRRSWAAFLAGAVIGAFLDDAFKW